MTHRQPGSWDLISAKLDLELCRVAQRSRAAALEITIDDLLDPKRHRRLPPFRFHSTYLEAFHCFLIELEVK